MVLLAFALVSVGLIRATARARVASLDAEARYKVGLAVRIEESYYSQHKSFADAHQIEAFAAANRSSLREFTDGDLEAGSSAVRIALTPAGALCAVARSSSGSYWGVGESIDVSGARTTRYLFGETLDPLSPCTPDAISTGSREPFPTASPTSAPTRRR